MISVLLATRDRSSSLARTLESIAECEEPECDWEIIVCDNGSTDGTQKVIAAGREILPLRAVFEPRPGKNIALNAGLLEAHGTLLVFTDDDVVVHKEWLRAYHKASIRHPDRLVFGGAIEAVLPARAESWLLQTSFAAPAFAHLPLSGGEAVMTQLPFGPNFALRREALDIANFDERFGPNGTNDYPMGSETSCLKPLADAGHHAMAVPTARVKHLIREEQVSRRFLAKRAQRAALGVAISEMPQCSSMPRLLGRPRWVTGDVLRALASGMRAAILGDAVVRAEARWTLNVAWALWRKAPLHVTSSGASPKSAEKGSST